MTFQEIQRGWGGPGEEEKMFFEGEEGENSKGRLSFCGL